MIKKHLRWRDLYDMLDSDGSASLDYGEVKEGLLRFKALNDALSPPQIEDLARSLFPFRPNDDDKRGSNGGGNGGGNGEDKVSWRDFERVPQKYAAAHFPGGSYAEWAGRKLLDARKDLGAALGLASAQAERLQELLAHIDELRVEAARAEELEGALSASRRQVATLVALRDEVLKSERRHGAARLGAEGAAASLEERAAALAQEQAVTAARLGAAQRAGEAEATARRQLEAEVTRLHEARALDAARVTAAERLAQRRDRERALAQAASKRVAAEAAESGMTFESLLVTKHQLEMRVLALEASHAEVVGQLYGQRIVCADDRAGPTRGLREGAEEEKEEGHHRGGGRGGPWWKKKIDALSAELKESHRVAFGLQAKVGELNQALALAERRRDEAEHGTLKTKRLLEEQSAALRKSQYEARRAEKQAADAAKTNPAKARWG